MSEIKVNIFFDESGKQNDRPTMMGGLMIPRKVYESSMFRLYNGRLKDRKFSIHWTDYKGKEEQKEILIKLVKDLMKYSSLIEFNVINYVKPESVNKQSFENMIYSKLPERIFYGLLRFHGYDARIKANIFIEDASEYRKVDLDKKIREQLNMQALYRGENYKIEKCKFNSKNEEVGVELVDLILGVIRTIIINNDSSSSKRQKNELVLELLKIQDFYSFISEIKYFEWSSNYELNKLDFKSYLKSFLSNQEIWLEYISKK